MARQVDGATSLCAELSKRLRDVRLERRCSAAKLAAALGITTQDIQRYEDGRHQITVPALILMCEALGVHPMEVIGPSVESHILERRPQNVIDEQLLVAQRRLEDICTEIAGAR